MSTWSLEPRALGARAAIAMAYVAAVALLLLLQEVGVRLRREEHRAWWAGTGRDLLNGAGFAAVAGVLRLYGFSWPAALLVGGTLTLALFGVYVFMVTPTDLRRARRWAVLVGVGVALPVIAWPGWILAMFASAASVLFGR